MSQPNIICLSIDSLRADFCSFLNEEELDTTPFLEKLSDDSAVYNNAYTPSTWTLPVHTSVFTGLFPPEHGILNGGEKLGNHPTFADILKQEGYSTAAYYQNSWLDTGEILNGFQTATREHDDSESPLRARIADSIRSVSPRSEQIISKSYKTLSQIHESLDTYREWNGRSKLNEKKDRIDQETIDKASDAIESLSDPFCWFVHLNGAHWKYNPPNPYHRKFTNRSLPDLVSNLVWEQGRIYGTRTNRLRVNAGYYQPPEQEVSTIKNLYRGCILYCDHLLKILINALKDAGKWENTVLFVFGDHGDAFGEQGIFGHHFTVDDSVTHIPLLIRDPSDRIESGVIHSPASLVDIYPTILSLAGVSGPETLGIDLSNESREATFTYYDVSGKDYYRDAPQRGVPHKDLPAGKQYAVRRSSEESLVYYPDENEYCGPAKDDESLRSILHNHLDEMERVETETGELSDEVSTRLEKMGYLRE